MDIRIPSSSVQYVRMAINSAQDQTSNLVSMAVMPRGIEPGAGDFKTAEWVAGAVNTAQVLIGPGSAVGELTEGAYKLWTKVTATPEVPVLESTNCLVIT